MSTAPSITYAVIPGVVAFTLHSITALLYGLAYICGQFSWSRAGVPLPPQGSLLRIPGYCDNVIKVNVLCSPGELARR